MKYIKAMHFAIALTLVLAIGSCHNSSTTRTTHTTDKECYPHIEGRVECR